MAHSVVHLQKPYTIIKEMEFEGACSKKMDANPVAVVEAFIHINNQLHQHEVELKRSFFSAFLSFIFSLFLV